MIKVGLNDAQKFEVARSASGSDTVGAPQIKKKGVLSMLHDWALSFVVFFSKFGRIVFNGVSRLREYQLFSGAIC